MRIRKLASVLAALMLAAVVGWSAAAAQTDTTERLDTLTGDKVIARFIDAVGGRDAYLKLTSRYQHATVALMANLIVPVTTYQARPNKIRSIMTSDQIGMIERGYDGTLFWEKGTMTGARLLEGQELIDAVREEAAFEKVTTWNDYFSKTEYIGTDSAAGAFCFKVRVYPKESPEQTWFFDQGSGLLLKMLMTMNTQMGAVPAEMLVGDYRVFDGVLTPYRVATSAAGMEMVMVIDSIAHNIAIPDSVFVPPVDVLELAKQKK